MCFFQVVYRTLLLNAMIGILQKEINEMRYTKSAQFCQTFVVVYGRHPITDLSCDHQKNM